MDRDVPCRPGRRRGDHVPGGAGYRGADLFAPRAGWVLALFFGIAGGLTAIGPVLRGYLTQWTWRAIFWVNIPVALIALALIVISKPVTEHKAARMDYRSAKAPGPPQSRSAAMQRAGGTSRSSSRKNAIETLRAADTTVGIDAGITSLVTLPADEKITKPEHEKRDRAALAKAQRQLSRKAKGSSNRAKARVKVARVHARIADRRRDHLHKLSTRIIRETQTVIIEDLAVRNMIRNHSLARAISDVAWAEFRRQLEYEADWYGRTVVAVDRFYPSSKTCSACGRLAATMPLNTREWTCAQCGTVHDRDVNAAKVLQAAGLAVLACGDGVRPPRT